MFTLSHVTSGHAQARAAGIKVAVCSGAWGRALNLGLRGAAWQQAWLGWHVMSLFNDGWAWLCQIVVQLLT